MKVGNSSSPFSQTSSEYSDGTIASLDKNHNLVNNDASSSGTRKRKCGRPIKLALDEKVKLFIQIRFWENRFFIIVLISSRDLIDTNSSKK